MARTARPLDLDDDEAPGAMRQGAALIGGVIVRNPVVVGGTTAFLVSLFYVSANALWYQPHFHSGVWFPTRDSAYQGPVLPADEQAGTTIRIERKPAVPRDPVVEQVQQVLRDMKLYDGTVDGISGPNTRKAIDAYRLAVGLQTGGIDEALLAKMGAGDTTAAIAPMPAPAPRQPSLEEGAGTVQTVSVAPAAATLPEANPMVIRIQAGLKAFGNEGIELDGIVGSRTRSAIREFQSLFGLEVTGEPDEALYRKMQEIGLTS